MKRSSTVGSPTPGLLLPPLESAAASPAAAGKSRSGVAPGYFPIASPGELTALPPSSHRCQDFRGSASLAATPLSRCPAPPPVPLGGRSLSARLPDSPSVLRHSALLAGLHPLVRTGVPVARSSGAVHLRDPWSLLSPPRSVLRLSPPASPATMTSADFSLRPAASPFQASGETSPGKGRGFPRTAAGFTALALGRRSFAVRCPLAPACAASYPVSVRQPAVSLPLLSAPASRPVALRFARGPCDQVPQRTCTSKSRPCWAHSGPGKSR